MSSLYLKVLGHTKHMYVWRCVQHLKHSNLVTINLKLPTNVDIKSISASTFELVSSGHCCMTSHLLPDRVTFQRHCSYLKTVLQRLLEVVPLAVRQRLHIQQNTALAHNKCPAVDNVICPTVKQQCSLFITWYLVPSEEASTLTTKCLRTYSI